MLLLIELESGSSLNGLKNEREREKLKQAVQDNFSRLIPSFDISVSDSHSETPAFMKKYDIGVITAMCSKNGWKKQSASN